MQGIEYPSYDEVDDEVCRWEGGRGVGWLANGLRVHISMQVHVVYATFPLSRYGNILEMQ